MKKPRPTLLVVGVDSTKTFTIWEWLEPRTIARQYSSINREDLFAVTGPLRGSIPAHSEDEATEAMLQRVLNESGFATLANERKLTRSIGDALLPENVRDQIALQYLANDRRPILLRLLPSQLCAQVPWELLPIEVPNRRGKPITMRLVEVADIIYDIPAGAHVGRSALPRAWDPSEGRALYVVDPHTRIEGRVLNNAEERRFAERMVGQPESWPQSGSDLTRIALSRILRKERPSRLFYLGHVVMSEENPAGTSLILSDGQEIYGRTSAIKQRTGTSNRPLSALDLMVGTVGLESYLLALLESEQLEASNLDWPRKREGEFSGAELWPMPPRVALIACDSGSDLRSPEPFGLATAAINAGAELVTATKWTLPTDLAYRKLAGVSDDVAPFTDAALAIDDAHSQDEPVARIAEWQRSRLRAWETSEGDVVASPLLWAAVSNYDGSVREVLRRGR